MPCSQDADAPSLDHDTTPLLGENGLEAQITEKPTPTPLPAAQLAVVCVIRLVDPVAFTQIFPYVNELVESLHVTSDPSQIGFYSGLIESAFSVALVFSVYHWARFSDRYGRRPVVLIGTAGIAAATILLGLSRTLSWVIISRTISGLFSGNIPAVQSMLGELTDSTNQATALSIYGFVGPLGSTLGPLIGGTFSDPARKFPSIFDFEFLRQYPYFMPCFVSSLLALFAFIFSYFYLNETLPSKRRNIRKSKYGAIGADYESLTSTTTLGPTEPISLRSLLAVPAIFALTLSGFAFGFLYTAFEVVFALFCYSPVKAGGLGFTTSQIGYSLVMAGCISAFIQLLIMPYLLRTFHAGKIYGVCMSMWLFTFVMFPLLNIVARNGLEAEVVEEQMLLLRRVQSVDDTPTCVLLWVGIGLMMVMSRIACLCSTLSMILAKQHAPDPSCLGATNGLLAFAMCLARVFAPAIVSSCYAISTGSNICGGYLWVIVMVLLSGLGCRTTRNLVKTPSNWM